MSIPYTRHSINEEDVAAVAEVLRGDWLTQGPSVTAFEEAIARKTGVEHAVAFSSGTAALHAAAAVTGLGPGDDLLTSAMTFAASANCAAYVGAVPRFADVDRDTANVTADTVAAAMTANTKIVIPVHFAGLPAPIAEIRERVGDDVVLVEDASHALGAKVDGKPVGSCEHSDMTVFSLHPAKAIAGGEGGVVTTRDADTRDALAEFRSHGFTKRPDRLTREQGGWYYEQQSLGFNYRLSDIHAALATSQLRRLDRFIEARIRVADRYRDRLADVRGLELPPEVPQGVRHAYHLFVVRTADGSDGRRRLYDQLHRAGVLAQVHYVPVYWHPWYRVTYGYEPGLHPGAERFYAGCLSLPCYPSLDVSDQDRVVSEIRKALA